MFQLSCAVSPPSWAHWALASTKTVNPVGPPAPDVRFVSNVVFQEADVSCYNFVSSSDVEIKARWCDFTRSVRSKVYSSFPTPSHLLTSSEKKTKYHMC